MSSIRLTSFGAATVPLSKIIPDKDFDIRPYGITAAFARFPYRPIGWETEELDWGDITPKMRVYEVTEDTPGVVSGQFGWQLKLPRQQHTKVAEFTTPDTPGNHLWKYYLYVHISSNQTLDIITQTASGDAIHTKSISGSAGNGFPYQTTCYVEIEPNTDVEIVMYPRIDAFAYVLGGTYIESYMASWPKTFDLTGKWLALGIDMKGLAATVKIQGVEMPYSDYPLYFPIAPTELSIPGEWDASQERPVIEVYK
jgi:hypothetical protein